MSKTNDLRHYDPPAIVQGHHPPFPVTELVEAFYPAYTCRLCLDDVHIGSCKCGALTVDLSLTSLTITITQCNEAPSRRKPRRTRGRKQPRSLREVLS